MIVVDASALVPALADDGAAGRDHRRVLREGQGLAAPEVLDVEVTAVLRNVVLRGELRESRARRALDDLMDLAIRRFPHLPLLPRVWELRGNVTPYDAVYVALAEALGVTMVTADHRLANAPGLRCSVHLVGT